MAQPQSVYQVMVIRNGVPGYVECWARTPQEAQARAQDTVSVAAPGASATHDNDSTRAPLIVGPFPTVKNPQ